MRKMVIVENNTNLKSFFSFFEKYSFPFIYLNKSQLSSLSKEDEYYLFIGPEDISLCLNEINQSIGAIIFYQSQKGPNTAKEKLEKHNINPKIVLGFIDVSLGPELYEGFLVKQFEIEEVPLGGISRYKLESLAKRLDENIQKNKLQLKHLKKLYDGLLPKRTQDIKGLTFKSRYAAGESSGGEFFDLIQKGQQIALFMSSSTSYVLSSLVLGHFGQLQSAKSLDFKAIEKIIEQLSHQTHNFDVLSDGSGEKLNMMICIIDLSSLQVKGINIGGTLCFSEGKFGLTGNDLMLLPGLYMQAKFEGQLERGAKTYFISPGLRRNCHNRLGGKEIGDFLLDNNDKALEDTLTEVLFQLKTNSTGTFLKHDAVIIGIEVSEHAIVQV